MALFRRKQADPPSVPETVELDGGPFRHHHGWSSDADNHFHLYLPPGEDPVRFRTRLQLDVHTVRGLTPTDAMRHWLPTHAARHDGSAEMNHELFSSTDGSGEYLLDFLLSHQEAGTPAWEWNAARFAPHPVGLVILTLTRRAYDDDIGPFLTDLADARPVLLGRFMDAPLPPVARAS